MSATSNALESDTWADLFVSSQKSSFQTQVLISLWSCPLCFLFFQIFYLLQWLLPLYTGIANLRSLLSLFQISNIFKLYFRYVHAHLDQLNDLLWYLDFNTRNLSLLISSINRMNMVIGPLTTMHVLNTSSERFWQMHVYLTCTRKL